MLIAPTIPPEVPQPVSLRLILSSRLSVFDYIQAAGGFVTTQTRTRTFLFLCESHSAFRALTKKLTEFTRLTNTPHRTTKARENKGTCVVGNVRGSQQPEIPVGGDVMPPAFSKS